MNDLDNIGFDDIMIISIESYSHSLLEMTIHISYLGHIWRNPAAVTEAEVTVYTCPTQSHWLWANVQMSGYL